MTAANNKSKPFLTTRELAVLAVLTALCLILALYGSIPVGPLTITTGILPVAIAAFVFGPKGGAIEGGMFGLISFLQAVQILPSKSALLVALAQLNAPLTFIQCVITRLLCGFCAGCIAWLIGRRIRLQIGAGLTGFFTAFLNTCFFMPCLFLLFGHTENIEAIRNGRGILVTMFGMITVNVICEWILTTIVASAVGTALVKAGMAGPGRRQN